MRIAIVGAGLSGLACAHELERLGVKPDLFEKRHRVGERFPNVETMAQFMHHTPHQDVFEHIRHELGLPLNPANTITTMVAHSQNHEATISGRLGYTTIRGHDDRSLERQLERHLNSPIHFNSNPDIHELKQEYDWVVVATGDQRWSRELNHWHHHISWWVRGANVTGDFNPCEEHFFFNTRYGKTGYALVAPFDERTACVGVAVPDSSAKEVDQYWETFRREQGHWWRTEETQFKLEGLDAGLLHRPLMGNIVFIGNAGGFLDGLGITGQCPAMASGVYAAQQMVLHNRALERFARRNRVYLERLWRLRRNVNAWTDEDMDRMVSMLNMGVGTALAHSPWNVLKPSGWLIDLLRFTDDFDPQVGSQAPK